MSNAIKKLINLYSKKFIELDNQYLDISSKGESTASILNDASSTLHKFVSWYGVPKPSLIGEQSSISAFHLLLLLDHDRRFQELYLGLMYQSKEFPESMLLILKKKVGL